MCEVVHVPGLGNVIVCGGHRRRLPPCVGCEGVATVLCDHRNSDGKTCDAPLCTTCAHHVGRNRDYCKVHAKLHPTTAALPFEEAS